MNNGEETKKLEVDAGPVKVRTQGYRLSDVIQGAQAVIMGLMLLMLYDLRAAAIITLETAKTASVAVAAAKTDHDKLTSAVELAADAQKETTYLLSLPQADREKLNIRMPESLRRRTY